MSYTLTWHLQMRHICKLLPNLMITYHIWWSDIIFDIKLTRESFIWQPWIFFFDNTCKVHEYLRWVVMHQDGSWLSDIKRIRDPQVANIHRWWALPWLNSWVLRVRWWVLLHKLMVKLCLCTQGASDKLCQMSGQWWSCASAHKLCEMSGEVVPLYTSSVRCRGLTQPLSDVTTSVRHNLCQMSQPLSDVGSIQ